MKKAIRVIIGFVFMVVLTGCVSTLEFDFSPGTGTPNAHSGSPGSAAQQPTITPQPGESFSHWSTHPSDCGLAYEYDPFLYPPSSGQVISLYACYVKDDYSVVLEKGQGDPAIGTSQVTVGYGQLLPVATAPEYAGHVFKGYYEETACHGTQYYDANMQATAPWMHAHDGIIHACWAAIVNEPVLFEGMNPIYWDDQGQEVAKYIDPFAQTLNPAWDEHAWYAYIDTHGSQLNSSRWANARSADGSYWVWIPRFIYRIPYGWHSTDDIAYVIDIQFVVGLDDTSLNVPLSDTGQASDSDAQWTSHPAFTFNNTAISGFWVAKFEASDNQGHVASWPNTTAWHLDINGAFNASLSMANETSHFGWDSTTLDTHLMRQSEWGAVAIMGYGNYGRHNQSITLNTTPYAGGGGNWLNNGDQSTTGNPYGVYDLVGGHWEWVAAHTTQSGLPLQPCSLDDPQYCDLYGPNYADAQFMKGGLIYETSQAGTSANAWYDMLSEYPHSGAPWFIRGGGYGSGSEAGLFAFNYATSDQLDNAFRPVLVPFETATLFEVTFYDCYGQLIDTQMVHVGDAALAPTVGNQPGYQFTGWSTAFNQITQDTAVYADCDLVLNCLTQMVQVGQTSTHYTIPINVDDSDTAIVQGGYHMGIHQVTYCLWYEVRVWAEQNNYHFQNLGQEGSHGQIGLTPSVAQYEPVTMISWRDAIVWLNALSEHQGFDPVYRDSHGNVIRDASDSNATVVDAAIQANYDGYRLPISNEWEMAARWKDDTVSTHGSIEVGGRYWTPGNYASGATHSTSAATNLVAWNNSNTTTTQPVGQLLANHLGIFDMNGNVYELMFDHEFHHLGANLSHRDVRGGSWHSANHGIQVGGIGNVLTHSVVSLVGFRLALGETNVIQYQVTFYDCFGQLIDTQMVDAGNAAVAPTVGNQPGYQFNGWSTAFNQITQDTAVHANCDLVLNCMIPTVQVGQPGTHYTIPIGIDDVDTANVQGGYHIGIHQVTYCLWYEVRVWALAHGYHFQNTGREGSHGNQGQPPSSAGYEPVTAVNWRNAIVWLNALSEHQGFDPVYRDSQGNVIRDARDSNATVVDAAVQANYDGYRLPTRNEWEMAARWKDDTVSTHGSIEVGGRYWTPGNYASGAIADYLNSAATQAVAWYSGAPGGNFTRPVGQLTPNHLGLFDMSGNVAEWTYAFNTANQEIRGGSWGSWAGPTRVGDMESVLLSTIFSNYGFRFVKNP